MSLSGHFFINRQFLYFLTFTITVKFRHLILFQHKWRRSAIVFANGHASVSNHNISSLDTKTSKNNNTNNSNHNFSFKMHSGCFTSFARPGWQEPKLAPVVNISSIDLYCRAFFPAAYILVTLVYWIGYTNALYERFRWNNDVHHSAF